MILPEALHVHSFKPQQSLKVGALVMPIFQMKELRQKSQSPATVKWQSQHRNSDSLTPQFMLLTTI